MRLQAELHYRLETDDTTSFDSPPPIERETATFKMQLANGVATFTMKEEYGSEGAVLAARSQVDEYLRAWEIDVALRFGLPEISFRYETTAITDLDPFPPDGRVVSLHGEVIGRSLVTAKAVVRRVRYPEPPEALVASPDMVAMWTRYEGYRQGREPLLSMAYFCLSVLEFAARNHQLVGSQEKGRSPKREKAAEMYGIDYDVLATLGELSSILGDDLTARKREPGSQQRLPTGKEGAWLEQVVRALIRRVGEVAARLSEQLPRISLLNFPDLSQP